MTTTLLVWKRGGRYCAFAAEYGTVIGERDITVVLPEPERREAFLQRVRELLSRHREKITDVCVEKL